jgi:hypothetical protein
MEQADGASMLGAKRRYMKHSKHVNHAVNGIFASYNIDFQELLSTYSLCKTSPLQ